MSLRSHPLAAEGAMDSDRLVLCATVEPDGLTALLAAARAAVAGGRGLAVDCSAAEFLPTAAVQVLIAARRACAARGLAFAVEGVRESAAAYLRRAGLGRVLGA